MWFSVRKSFDLTTPTNLMPIGLGLTLFGITRDLLLQTASGISFGHLPCRHQLRSRYAHGEAHSDQRIYWEMAESTQIQQKGALRNRHNG